MVGKRQLDYLLLPPTLATLTDDGGFGTGCCDMPGTGESVVMHAVGARV